MRVFEAVEPFMIYCQAELRHAPATLDKTRECFRSWLLPRFGHLLISEIKPVHVLALRQAMVEKNLSSSRQTNLLVTLKSLLRFGKTVLEINCLEANMIKLPGRKTPTVEYLTNAEIKAVRDCIDTSRLLGLRMRALFETLLATGMRIKEALSLDRDSINTETKEAAIIGKGNKRRTVFFSDEALRWISRYLTVRRDNNSALFVTAGTSPKRLGTLDLPRLMRALARHAGIEKRLTPHLLRHTFCTNLRNNGADISLIKDLAGHQNIQTTARYYLATDKEVLKAALGKYLNYATGSDS